MSSCYGGVRARCKTYSPTTDFIPFVEHSLILVGENAAECCRLAVEFFAYCRAYLIFFSASTHRWEFLTAYLGSKKNESVVALSADYEAIQSVLNSFIENPD